MSYLSFSTPTTLNQTIVIFHPDTIVSGLYLLYPTILCAPHTAPRMSFFIQMLISKPHSPLKESSLGKENKVSLGHLCQKLSKFSKSDGDVLKGEGASLFERALTDQLWDDLSFKMNNSTNCKPLIKPESMSSH